MIAFTAVSPAEISAMSDVVRILVVDDEIELREMVADYLSGNGFTVITVPDSAAARTVMATQSVDLAILDVNMPGEDGLSLARHLREHYNLAIIMLTAAGDTIDRIVGLEVGADDYLPKPFDPRELLARLKAILRRLGPAATVTQDTQRVQFGQCVLNLSQRTLRGSDGTDVPISAQEFLLLKVFADNPNRVLSRDEILNLTASRDWDPFDRSVDIRIARLRRKIESHPEKPQTIKTIRGTGYLFAKPRV